MEAATRGPARIKVGLCPRPRKSLEPLLRNASRLSRHGGTGSLGGRMRGLRGVIQWIPDQMLAVISGNTLKNMIQAMNRVRQMLRLCPQM